MIVKKVNKVGYVFNKAAYDAIEKREFEGETWYVISCKLSHARCIEPEEKPKVEKLFRKQMSKCDIAKKLNTNTYQLNKTLKEWYGTYIYKDILGHIGVETVEINDESSEE